MVTWYLLLACPLLWKAFLGNAHGSLLIHHGWVLSSRASLACHCPTSSKAHGKGEGAESSLLVLLWLFGIELFRGQDYSTHNFSFPTVPCPMLSFLRTSPHPKKISSLLQEAWFQLLKEESRRREPPRLHGKYTLSENTLKWREMQLLF